MRPWTRGGLFSIKSQRANRKKGEPEKRAVGRAFKRLGGFAWQQYIVVCSTASRYENVIHNRLPVLVLMYVPVFETPACHLQQQLEARGGFP
jgi:hypothetical protein